MQDNWQEIDRQMRSVLHDAEEKTPRRVWRAVSARLDSAAGAAAWWKWAVPALAAAAIAAALVLPGSFRQGSADSAPVQVLADASAQKDSPLSGSRSDSDALAVDIESLAGMTALSAPAPSVRRGKAVRNSGASALPEASAEVEVSASSGTEQDSVSDDGRQEGSGLSGSGKDKEADAAETAARWAQISMEEDSAERMALRFSGLYAQGGLGGNDSNISYGSNGISRLAPGAGSADAGISENGPSTYGVPVTFALGVRFRLSDKLSLGTGLEYSLLTRSFTGSYSGSSNYEGTIFHNVQYVGVPVNAYYDLLRTAGDTFSVYAKAGAAADLCVSNRYRLSDAAYTVISDKAGGLQFSAMAGLGAQFKLTGRLALFVDPSVRYFFHGDQPKSLRTDKPFMFNFDAGLRFNL